MGDKPSRLKYVGVTTKPKKAKMKSVEIFRQARKVIRPVPAWYTQRFSGYAMG